MAVVGTEMDYVDDDIRSEFVFNNPNSKVQKFGNYKHIKSLGNLWLWRKLFYLNYFLRHVTII